MEKGHTIKVLDKGFVRYVDHFGSDERILEAARISYKSPSKGPEADKKLLHYLWKNLHLSPFEQVNITFNIRMPIFVMREFVRHRTFKINEMSGRYVQLTPDFYIPDNWRRQDTKNKQGSVIEENWNPELDERPGCCGDMHATGWFKAHCNHSYELYELMLGAGIAREMARMVLPVNIYTEVYVNCDIRNLINFFNLRLAPNAQFEIRETAKAMFEVFREFYPWCAEAYEKYKFQLVETS